MLDTWIRDARLAIRSLLRERAVTAVALGSLAIGIAANATVFSLVQAVEFPQLIYPSASRLVFLESANLERDLAELPISAPDGLDIAATTRTLVTAGLTADRDAVVREAAVPSRRGGREVTPAFFEAMGVPPAMGRTIAAGDADTVVLSDRLWRSEFGADPSLVGRTVHLDGEAATVVGVMPARFDLDADFWMPLAPTHAAAARDDRRFTTFARLAPGASVADATRELAGISARLATDHPATNRGWVTFPRQLTRQHGQDSRDVFFLLQGAVGFVLLIACANIANILLARGTRRAHEMALRVALGAGRGRLVRQLLTESVLLAAAGGAIGVGLSAWGIRLARAIGGFPDAIDPTLNGLVVGFTAAISMLTGVLCGIVPALRASNTAPEAVLRAEGGRGEAARGRGRLRAALVAVQVASAVVLTATAGLMLQTLVNRQRVDLGFNPHGAVRGDLVFAGPRYADPAALRTMVEATVDSARRLPGVTSAGVSAFAMSPGVGAQLTLTVPGEADRALATAVRRNVEAVTPEYFAAMGVALARGRAFSPADRAGAAPVAIVNEEMARHLWPGRNPLGERLRLGSPSAAAPVATIVGVVSSIRRSAMHDFVVARVYVPFAQYPTRSLSLVVRTSGDPASTARGLGAVVHQIDGTLALDGLRTVEEDVAQFLGPVRLLTLLFTAFGVIGLLLAALGVFGTMTYAVTQRERELAVRSALGAGRGDLIRLVMRAGLVVTAIGIGPGALLAIAAGQALGSLLYGVAPADPLTIGGAAAFLAAVALLACYRPARAAASVDPMVVLRQV